MELLLTGPVHELDRRFALPDGETLIGRRPDCRIVLRAPGIAPRHARVFSVNGRSVLHGIDDEWPVYVNGDAVRRRVLIHGDDIQLAHYRLRCLEEDRAEPQSQAAAKPPAGADAPGPSSPTPDSGATDGAPAHAASGDVLDTPARSFRLDVLTGVNRGRRIPLIRSRVVLGFDRRRLAELRCRDDEGLSARRLAEDPNILPNGEPLGEAFTALRPGDVLSVQLIDMRVHEETPLPARPPHPDGPGVVSGSR